MSNNKSNIDSKITASNIVSFKLSPEEMERFEQLRSASGLNKTDFIKKALLSDKVNILDEGAELFSALARCADTLDEINTVLNRKNISDIGLNALLTDIKERQRSLTFRFSDIEADIAKIFDRITTTTKGEKSNDNEEHTN